MTDTQIIDLFFERSEQAITALDTAHGGAVKRLVRNILGDARDAEECVNDTYLGAWNAIPPHRPSPLRTFVCAIARNLAVKRYHSNAAEKRNSHYDAALDELAGTLSDGSDAEDVLTARELADAINAFLDTLPPEDKYIFLRRYWYAEPLASIAASAGLRRNAAAVRLHRLREKLHTRLKKEGLLS